MDMNVIIVIGVVIGLVFLPTIIKGLYIVWGLLRIVVLFVVALLAKILELILNFIGLIRDEIRKKKRQKKEEATR
jgi:hypothetical protein